MAEANSPMIIDYDAESDVLRVFFEPPTPDTIAHSTGGMTVIVSSSLDRVVGIVFEHYAGAITKTRNLSELTDKDREQLFETSRGMIEGLAPVIAQSVGPVAKDRIAHWMEVVGAR